MKYICFGYMDSEKAAAMSESELSAALAECFEYDSALRKKGELVGGEVLQEPRHAKTLRQGSGKVSVGDGPFANSKERLTGILSLETTDIEHAVRLMSGHPSLRMSMSWEIRPVADMATVMKGTEPRRWAEKANHSRSKNSPRKASK
jgi:hypothetical protein